MNKHILSIILFLNSCCAFAQWEGCYRLVLKDKAGSDYCALSERAMQRRTRQGIPLDEKDLNVSSLYLQQLREQGWEIVSRSRWLNTVVVRNGGKAIADDQFKALDFVLNYQPVTDVLSETASAQSRSAVQQNSSWSKFQEEEALESVTQMTDQPDVPLDEVKAKLLHEAGHKGKGMLIAVLDGGFYNLPAMPFFHKVVGWYDCYAKQDIEGTALWKSSTHGTQVTSIMAADIKDGVWGTAPEASYFVIRTEYDGTETPLEEDMWVEGAEYADSIGADLINSSLGYNSFDNTAFNPSYEDLCKDLEHVSRGAAVACQKGLLVVSAAGNDRAKPWHYIGFPADAEHVFTIGASTPACEASYFTSEGWLTPYVKPDVSCRGQESWHLKADTGLPAQGNGTSYASPFMCGLMASLWSAVPEQLPAHLREVVRSASHQASQPEPLLGYGIPDFVAVMDALNIEHAQIDAIQELNVAANQEVVHYDLWGRKVQNNKQNGLLIVQKRGK